MKNQDNPTIKIVGISIPELIELNCNELMNNNGQKIGEVKSSAASEWLNKTVAIAHLKPEFDIKGNSIQIMSNKNPDRNIIGTIRSRRFYNRLLK